MYLRRRRNSRRSDHAAELKPGLLNPRQRALDSGRNGFGFQDVRLEELGCFGVFGDQGGPELLVHVQDCNIAAGGDEIDDAGAAES